MKILPDIYVSRITDIAIDVLTGKGIKGIAIDIDNTLTADGSFYIDEAISIWLNSVKNTGISFCIVSNNHPPRVEPFATQIGMQYICEARKPRKDCKEQLLEMLNFKPDEVVMIGDQIFTDVYFAKKCGFYSILLDPIAEDKHRGAAIKRFFERPLKYFLRKRRL